MYGSGKWRCRDDGVHGRVSVSAYLAKLGPGVEVNTRTYVHLIGL
jgi:hypothetical protein